ncbi:MAG: histidine triad nucleotide-binding protein [Magnetococcales bacterium]|nr:histidine triad nucleotide-binding protein [Magnetococcales bacterium]
MSADCIFCLIAAGSIPCDKVYEDDTVLAFQDLHPQTPTHTLVIPKRHIPCLDDLNENDRNEAGHLLERVAHVARTLGLAEKGYRTVINTREHGGQEVDHLHIHILGGRRVGPMVSRPGI